MSSKVDQIIRHQTMRALQISVCHAVKGKKVWKAISWCLYHSTLESFYCTKFTKAISYMLCLNPRQQFSAWYVSFCFILFTNESNEQSNSLGALLLSVSLPLGLNLLALLVIKQQLISLYSSKSLFLNYKPYFTIHNKFTSITFPQNIRQLWHIISWFIQRNHEL